MKRVLAVLLAAFLVISMVGCTQEADEPETPSENDVAEDVDETEDDLAGDNGEIILSTTTSTEDSGLLDFLLPEFKEDTGIDVKTIAVGTGKALQMGRDGEADVLLVHAKESELEFVEEGYGTERHDVMYNDFILVGPEDDPLNLKEDNPDNILEGLKTIAEEEFTFVSRGDDSGTHKKELGIWETAGIEPSGDWYLDAGSGMGDVLKLANERQAYTITDRATYLSMLEELDLDIAIEGDENLFNQYGVIPVNPEVLEDSDQINHEGALEFKDWLISDKAQELIEEYGVDEYGEALFIPNAE